MGNYALATVNKAPSRNDDNANNAVCATIYHATRRDVLFPILISYYMLHDKFRVWV